MSTGMKCSHFIYRLAPPNLPVPLLDTRTNILYCQGRRVHPCVRPPPASPLLTNCTTVSGRQPNFFGFSRRGHCFSGFNLAASVSAVPF